MAGHLHFQDVLTRGLVEKCVSAGGVRERITSDAEISGRFQSSQFLARIRSASSQKIALEYLCRADAARGLCRFLGRSVGLDA